MLYVHPNSPHAVIIGSGFGGLAAAIRLGARGYRVTVVEKLDAPGGRAYVHEQDGFTFDAGPTVITAPFLFEELWALCGRKLSDDIDMRPVTPFYRIRFHDGSVFDYTGDAAGMCEEVRKFSPDDVEGYERFVRMSEAIFRVGFEQLAHVPFGSWTSMAKIAPAMVRLQSFRTVYGLVSKHVRDERLRQVMSFHPLLVGGNPFSTTSIYALIAFLERKWGVHFPVGGTGALVRGLVSLIEGLGGQIRCSAEVQQILVEEGRTRGVELTTGEVVPADVVVSDADSAWTYRYLVPQAARRHWTDRRIEKQRYSMSLFVWYFGTRRQYRDVAHHTILLGPRYRGLLEDIFERHVLADDFSLYLHRPTATDPSLAPPGCDAFYVLSPVPNLLSGTDWRLEQERYRQRIERMLSETLLPGLGDALVTSRLLTPQDFHDRLNSFRGAAFGMEPVLTQSAYFRPHNKSEDIEGLYFVGAGTHPGAGLPGVLSSARVLDTVVPDPTPGMPSRLAVPSVQPELDRADLKACRTRLRVGSRSFAAASLLLPRRVREPVAPLYAFCRVADDAVDESRGGHNAVLELHTRLADAYAGNPHKSPVDRALAYIVRKHDIPQELLRAMLEGFAWDAEGRRYGTIEELYAYCARVAGTVGAMMTVLMGPRDWNVLARACDLGVAMQLTNIARDVGEDARHGRLYLPLAWLREEQLDADGFLLRPVFSSAIGEVVKRLLIHANMLYARADAGIAMLPHDCRPAIRAARLIYAEIGREIERAGYDSVSRRAVVSGPRKLALLARGLFGTVPGERTAPSLASSDSSDATWRVGSAPPLDATLFLVRAAAHPTGHPALLREAT